MSTKRKTSLRIQVKREISLWCLFALDNLPLFARSITPLPLKSDPEAVAHAYGLSAHLDMQLLAWKDDFGVARLLFSHLKNRAKLEEIWQDDDLWNEVAQEIKQYLSHQVAIDTLISLSSLHWKLQRMGSVDRAVLRLGTYELCFHDQLPARAVLNQAVELGKRYGSSESGRFINGVLDRVAQELLRIRKRLDQDGAVNVMRK